MIFPRLPFKFVHTRILIVMNPSNAIKVTHAAHIFGKFFRFGPCEVVDDGNDVAVGVKSCDNFLLIRTIV